MRSSSSTHTHRSPPYTPSPLPPTLGAHAPLANLTADVPAVPWPAPGEPPFPPMACPPSAASPLIFVHLPKNAGTTVRAALRCAVEGWTPGACLNR